MPSPPERGPAFVLRILRTAGATLLRQPRRWAWIAPLTWASLIWTLSSIQIRFPAGDHPSVPFLANTAHAGEFGILALLLVPLAPRRENWVVLDRTVLTMVAAVALSYAILDEVHQSLVDGRHATPFDLLTDATGIYCTLKIVLYLSEHEATGRGLVLRFAAGLALCALSAGFATLGAP